MLFYGFEFFHETAEYYAGLNLLFKTKTGSLCNPSLYGSNVIALYAMHSRFIRRSMPLLNIKAAVNAVVDSCIKDGIMTEFLTKHKAEVMNVCLTEFDEKVFVDGIREEGIEIGISQGRIEAYLEMIDEGNITLKEAAKRLNMSEAALSAYREKHRINA